MSLKIRRYQAEESEFTKAARNRTQIEVPASVGYTDLTSSKLVFDMEPQVSGQGTNGVVPCTFGLDGQQVGGAQCLLRSSLVESRENGFMNEQREQNVVSANHDWYLRSRAAEDNASLFGNSTNKNYGVGYMSSLPDNPWVDYSRPVVENTAISTQSVTRRAEIPVPWKHCDEFGSIAQFPNIAVGNLVYKLRLEDQQDVMSPAKLPMPTANAFDNITLTGGETDIGIAAFPIVITKTVANHWFAPKVGQYLTVLCTSSIGPAVIGPTEDIIASVTEVGGQYSIVLATGVTVGANAVVTSGVAFLSNDYESDFTCDNNTPVANEIGTTNNALILPNIFDINPFSGETEEESLNRCPLFVGMCIRVVSEDNVADDVYYNDAVVASLEAVGADLHVTVSDGAGAAGVDIGVANVVTPYIGARYDLSATKIAVSWLISEIYAQLHEIQLLPSQQEAARRALSDLEIPFFSRYVKQRNMPSTTVHTEVIQADPNCVGLTVLTPQNLTLLSGFDNCESYRFSIDGKNTTNRDVLVGNESTVGRQLHNHMLKRFWGNTGKRLRKYDANTWDYVEPNNKTTHAMFPLVTPMVPRPITVQLQLFSTTAMAGKPVFYVFHHQRSLVLSNGRAKVM